MEKPKVAADVIGWLVDGKSGGQIAAILATKKIQVSRQAVVSFAQRHRTEIDALTAAAVTVAQNHTIALKEARLAEKNERWLKAQQVIRERGAEATWKDIPGWTTGLLVHQFKAIGSGRNMQLVDEFVFDAALFRAIDQVEREAAEELGDIPKEAAVGPTIINIIRNSPGLGI